MKLLCVDDNSKQRQIIDLMLAATGIDVEFAENGQEAVAACQSTSYDAVLMDIEMPVMSGLQAAREIGEATPILFVSGHAQLHETVGNGHLAKPFTADGLIRALNHILHLADGKGVQNRIYAAI